MLKFFLSILLSLLVIICFSAHGQYRNKQPTKLRLDTTNTAILKIREPWIFDTTYKQAELNQNDLSIIDSCLVKAVNYFNSWQKKNNSVHPWKIDLKSHAYSKQLVVVINKKGEKQVWVNCFCTPDNTDWKSKLVYVEDGATCFFNFKINLSSKTYYDFRVNSAA